MSKTYKVEYIAAGAEVTDRTLSRSHLEKDLGVKAPKDLRWYRGAAQLIDDPDPTLLDYFKTHGDEFKVTELKGDAAAETPA